MVFRLERYNIPDVAEMLGIPLVQVLDCIQQNKVYTQPTDNPEEVLAEKDFVIQITTALRFSDDLPLVPLTTIAKFMGVNVQSLRAILRKRKYDVLATPWMGDCLRFCDAALILDDLKSVRQLLTRFDRGALLWWILARHSLEPIMLREYSAGLEREISRISRFKNPWRAFKAGQLWNSYLESKAVAESLPKREGVANPPQMEPFGAPTNVKKVDKEIKKLLELIP